MAKSTKPESPRRAPLTLTFNSVGETKNYEKLDITTDEMVLLKKQGFLVPAIYAPKGTKTITLTLEVLA